MSLLSERRQHGRLTWLMSVALLLGGGIVALTILPAFDAAPLQARSPSAEPAKPVADIDDLQMIPDDIAAFATLNVAEAWDKEIVKTFLKQTAEFKPVESITQFLGVAPPELQRVTFIGTGPNDYCVLVTTRKPVEPETIQKALLPKAAKVSFKGKNYLAQDKMALHFMPGYRTYAYGSLGGVHLVATQPGSDKGTLAAARTSQGRRPRGSTNRG